MASNNRRPDRVAEAIRVEVATFLSQDVKDPPDVGNTCFAVLALLRAGNTPKEGPYAKNMAKAIEFICTYVEKSDDKTLYVTDVRDTQLQSKIGPYVDTFLVSMVLSELKGKVPDLKLDFSDVGKQIGQAGRQLGRLAQEVQSAREKAEKIGKALG